MEHHHFSCEKLTISMAMFNSKTVRLPEGKSLDLGFPKWLLSVKLAPRWAGVWVWGDAWFQRFRPFLFVLTMLAPKMMKPIWGRKEPSEPKRHHALRNLLLLTSPFLAHSFCSCESSRPSTFKCRNLFKHVLNKDSLKHKLTRSCRSNISVAMSRI